ncbi:sigma factor-like helix-turn-helix DNA-binding protein [Streptomyces sp. NPDC058466]|uniref:sigma factor-like helix-turn-helix DNA-binding protein n=1 Tax=Streptomyces sp. NPDC058466 TaxID=3346512 RepID=UPI003647E04A
MDSYDLVALMWSSGLLDDRDRAAVEARSNGATLDEVGSAYGLSREWARQVQTRAQKALTPAADVMCPDWREKAKALGDAPATPRAAFADAMGVTDHVALEPLLSMVGLRPPVTWAGPVRGWWTGRPGRLDALLRELAEAAPLRADDLDRAAAEVGLPEELPLVTILSASASRLALSSEGHWVRRRARGRDAAYLWLLEAGRPAKPEELLKPMSTTTVAAVREALRRDERFVQVRPAGVWALAEWSHLPVSPHTSAVDALIAVVRESGPLSMPTLFAKTAEIYPVTQWRLRQCLLSDQIGETDDGLIDLVARGARPIEDKEPTKPDSVAVAESGEVVGVRLSVTKDVLRGSGIAVHTWLTWYLGLRQAPMSRTFSTVGNHASLVIRRGTSVAQLSSLRHHAKELNVVEGCVLAVLMRLDDNTAQVRHGCADGECPAVAGTA